MGQAVSESWVHKRSRIVDYYDALVAQFGHDPQACDYGQASSQLKKFEVLAEALPVSGKRVLDVGCGFADFARFLKERYPDVSYEGVDVTPSMVEEARRARPDLALRHLDILEQDPGGPYNLVTANGIFYLLGEDARGWMKRLIARMFELSSEAVAFNSLSAWADRKESGEFYADPIATVEYCRTLTPWVALRHDYLPHDFTIYMYRERGVR